VRNIPLPSVLILGDQTRSVYTSYFISLTAKVAVAAASCNSAITAATTSTPSPTSNLLLTWTVFSNGVLSNTILSTSTDPAVFHLSPYSLTVGITYTIVATIYETSTLMSASNSVTVVVQPGNIKAVLSCSQQISFSSDKRLTIDASKSYDEDKPALSGVAAGLSFSWTCQMISPKLSSTCSFYILNSDLVNQPAITLTSIAQFVPSKSLLTVYVTEGKRIDQTNVTVNVL
jgi:hypothetical protein